MGRQLDHDLAANAASAGLYVVPNFVGFMNPMLGVPGGMQMPGWRPSSGSAQILLRQQEHRLLPVGALQSSIKR